MAIAQPTSQVDERFALRFLALLCNAYCDGKSPMIFAIAPYNVIYL
jgi:hypothetical protein